MQLLGKTEIPVTVIDLDAVVRGEFAENGHRKDFTLSERWPSSGRWSRSSGRRRGSGWPALGKFSERKAVRSTRSPSSSESTPPSPKAEAVVEAAEAEPEKYGKLLADMDRTGRANGPFKRLRVMKQAEQIRAEPPPLPGRGPYRGGMIDIPWAYEPDDDDVDTSGAACCRTPR